MRELPPRHRNSLVTVLISPVLVRYVTICFSGGMVGSKTASSVAPDPALTRLRSTVMGQSTYKRLPLLSSSSLSSLGCQLAIQVD